MAAQLAQRCTVLVVTLGTQTEERLARETNLPPVTVSGTSTAVERSAGAVLFIIGGLIATLLLPGRRPTDGV